MPKNVEKEWNVEKNEKEWKKQHILTTPKSPKDI